MYRSIGNPPLVPGTQCNSKNSSHSREIQHSCGSFLKIGQSSQYEMVFESNGVANCIYQMLRFSQCGFVCDSIQTQTPIVCFSDARQPSLYDIRFIHELEKSTWLCISSNSSDTTYSHHSSPVSVQNRSKYPSLASRSLVLRGIIATGIRPDSTSIPFKLTNTTNGKV